MDNVKKKLGENIRRLRRSRSMKQHELAELVGVEDKTISRIEVGGNYPSMDLLVRISNVLNYDITEFVNFNDKISQVYSDFDKNEIKVIKRFLDKLEKSLI